MRLPGMGGLADLLIPSSRPRCGGV